MVASVDPPIRFCEARGLESGVEERDRQRCWWAVKYLLRRLEVSFCRFREPVESLRRPSHRFQPKALNLTAAADSSHLPYVNVRVQARDCKACSVTGLRRPPKAISTTALCSRRIAKRSHSSTNLIQGSSFAPSVENACGTPMSASKC